MACCGRFRSRSVEDAATRSDDEILSQAESPGVRETRQYLREFSDVTTLHGIRYVGEKNRHPFERLCWVVAIALSAALCSVEMGKLWYRWQTAPVIVSLAPRPTSISSIPFPAVTVCPENKIRRSQLDVAAVLDNLLLQLNGTSSFESSEEQLFAETASLICRNDFYAPQLPSTFVPNTMHLKVMEQLSPGFEDVFVSCHFRGMPIECSEIFRPILTELGICFSFNIQEDHELFTSELDTKPLDPKRNESARNSSWDLEEGYSVYEDEYPRRAGPDLGPIFGLRVVLRSRDEDVQKMCSSGDPATFKVIVHAPTEFPDTYGNFFNAVPGSESLVAVRPATFSTSSNLRGRGYTPFVRGCNYPEDHDMKIFRTYTKTNCVMGECFVKAIRNHCGCQPWSLPLSKTDNMTHCSRSLVECGEEYKAAMRYIIEGDIKKQLKSQEVAAFCGCMPGCHELKYNFHANTVQYEHQYDNDTQGYKFAKLAVFLEETTFYGNHRSELYGLTDLIASCGGLLGLFTGFSFITAVEVIYFASLRLACHRRVNNKFSSSLHSDETE